jgi:hypothetical protein
VQEAEAAGKIAEGLAEMAAMVESIKAQAVTFTKTGRPWLDAMLVFAEVASALVRPVLAYWYCVLGYGAYKVATYYMVLSTGASWPNAITTLWTPQDYAVMTSIIGFWYVDRQLRKSAR